MEIFIVVDIKIRARKIWVPTLMYIEELFNL